MEQYDRSFYKMLANTARKSAQHVVPIVLRLMQPTNVIDIGCGTGAWLSTFAAHGIVDFAGVDGDFGSVDFLEIPPEKFTCFDLTKPYRCDKRFDLVLSLEVAEHLPESCAESFVTSLTRLGPVVLFSAAIPGQGGTQHLNEQWPDYWAELFKSQEFVPIDCIRRQVWNNDEVSWWYSQNMLLFCDRGYLGSNQVLERELERCHGLPLSIVHPKKLSDAVWRERMARTAAELCRYVPRGAGIVLVDDGTSGDAFHGWCTVIPFPERDGVYAGTPADSASAIAELKRLQPSADFVVIVWSAFWWVSFYSEWHDWLVQNFDMLTKTESLIAFDLRSGTARHRKHNPRA